jgi:pyruvate dehydrogenase (quinone)
MERTMAQTSADQMVGVLAAAGVKRVYGVVGDSLNGFTDAIRRREGIEWLHVRHEEVAAFAAGAHVPAASRWKLRPRQLAPY